MLAIAHIINEIAVMINLLVFIVHWGMIHFKTIDEFRAFPVQYYHLHAIHTIPALSTFINKLLTKINLVAGHYKIFPVLAIVYSSINYIGV